MRAGLHPLVRAWWAGSGGVVGQVARWATLPAEFAYRAGIAIRNRSYDSGRSKVHRLPAPVISVGNLVVGGAGKTPVSAWLAGELARSGLAPAVVARGYGRDELELHRRWNPTVRVHAHPDRFRAGLEALAGGADVIVMDDGFQHRRLARNLDLVLLPAEEPFPGRLLPRGPYREGPASLRRADAALITYRGGSREGAESLLRQLERDFPGVEVGLVGLSPSGWQELGGHPAGPPEGPLAAVSSVARPESFERLVEEVTGTQPLRAAFPDHHEFSPRDVEAIRRLARGATLVTTEKDAVKLERFAGALPPVRVLALHVEPEEGVHSILERVLDVAGSSRRKTRQEGSRPEPYHESP